MTIRGTRSSVLTIAMLTAAIPVCGTAAAQSQAPALTGKVTSQEEGAMEGVLVSAKRANSTMTVTVVSNAEGQNSASPAIDWSPASIRSAFEQ
jgi:hypothetical protein